MHIETVRYTLQFPTAVENLYYLRHNKKQIFLMDEETNFISYYQVDDSNIVYYF